MKKSNGSIVGLVMAIVLLTGSIVGVIIGAVNQDSNLLGFCGILAFTGVLVLTIALFMILINKKAQKNTLDPSTLSYQTYGEGEAYTYFLAYPNKKRQDTLKAVGNVVGVLAFFTGGVGVFTWGTKSLDVFVSDTELVINDKRANRTLSDKGFKCIPAGSISDLTISSEGGLERVTVKRKDTKKNSYFGHSGNLRQRFGGSADSVCRLASKNFCT